MQEHDPACVLGRGQVLAELTITAASVISTMNVERPPARSSDAPIRVKILSIGPMTQASAGTKLPHQASTAIRATCRM
jgi:hypothetical protein